MAEEHQIEARILLRYDTYSNWMNSTTILKQGEAAIAVIPRVYNIAGTDTHPDNTPPAVGIKIGDGYNYFSDLPWVQGVAADVYNWAKQSTKPIYDASEITNLDTYIAAHGGGSGGGEGSVTIQAKEYQLVRGTDDNINKYYLQSRTALDGDWIVDTTHYIDLNDLNEISTWIGSAIEDYWTLDGYVNDKINTKINALDYSDSDDYEQVVVAVSQNNGLINVQKATLNMNRIEGLLPVSQGGTGLKRLEPDEVLIGNGINAVKTKPVINVIEDNSNLVTAHAVVSYVTNATAGLTGAMHYIGEATVDMTNSNGKSINPQIAGYNFSQAKPGDVVTFEAKEYVWEGSYWRLLGDEGSYAVKGSITDADIADEANISINKIHNLSSILDNKVDVIEGKSLTSNDFTNEYKQKLDNIEDNAQRNLIEHIYINGIEAIPTVIEGKDNSLSIRLSSLTPEEEEKLRGIESEAQVNKIEHIFLNENELPIKTVKSLSKSVQLELLEYTETEQQKLAGIANNAQVNTIESITVNGSVITPTQDKIVEITIPDHAEHANKIEKIYLNGVEQVPDSDKYVNIQIDESAVSFTVLKGARVPTGIPATPYEDIDLDETTKKLEFAKIAKTGWVYDIINTPASNTTDYLILRCGDSTTLVD